MHCPAVRLLYVGVDVNEDALLLDHTAPKSGKLREELAQACETAIDVPSITSPTALLTDGESEAAGADWVADTRPRLRDRGLGDRVVPKAESRGRAWHLYYLTERLPGFQMGEGLGLSQILSDITGWILRTEHSVTVRICNLSALTTGEAPLWTVEEQLV